ncbi:MAG: hypothetical protein ACOC4B_03520, partial [Bacteroidota bacterium]
MNLLLEKYPFPPRIKKPIESLVNSKEKAEKYKKLLDFGEVLVIYLASVTLGEYKKSQITNVKFERSLKSGANLSVGVYVGIIRESLKALKQAQVPSVLENLFPEKKGFESTSIKLFIKSFDAIKKGIEKEGMVSDFSQIVETCNKPGQLNGKTSLADFFNTFVQLRNKTAHPIYLNKEGVQIHWPSNEEYFDVFNPLLENAFNNIIEVLKPVWDYREFKVLESDSDILVVEANDQNDKKTVEEFYISAQIESGLSILIRETGEFIINDMRRNLKPGAEALR